MDATDIRASPPTATSPPPLRVLSITSNDLGISYGPAVHYLELWNKVSRLGDDILVEGIAPRWTDLPPIIEPAFLLRRYPVAIPQVRQVLWDVICALCVLVTRADVVYVRVSRFHFALLFALRIRKTLRVAIELNGSATADADSRGQRGLARSIAARIEQVLIRRANVVFAVTEQLRTYAEHTNPQASHIYAPNGVAEHFFTHRSLNVHAATPRSLTAIYVGTFTAWDGACKIKDLANQFPDVTFIMIGDGGRRPEVEKGAPSNMRFLGWISYKDLPKYYAQADVAIVLYELNRHRAIGSSPLKLREYMASELPIFTSDAAGTEAVTEFGIGVRSRTGSAEDFEWFLRCLDGFRARYPEVRKQLSDRISWTATARTTLDALKKLAYKK